MTTRTRLLPWVGAGTSGEWRHASDALEESGLLYQVEQVNAYVDHGNKLPGVLANRRIDTDEIIAVTSPDYGVVQNIDAFGLLDPFCKAGGIIEHAGMTVQGMCFMVMRMPCMAFDYDGDDFELYVCAMNSFNTRFPLAIIITPVRVYCQNMFRKLMKRGDAVLTIKHGRFASERMLSASKASTLLLDYQTEFVDTLDRDWYLTRDPGDVESFVERMLPLTPETPDHPRAKFTNERVERQRNEFIRDYYLAHDNLKYKGSRLGILNAYYDWITHHVPVRASSEFEDIRFGNLMSGQAVSNKLILSA